MNGVVDKVGEALLMAAGMAWQTGWTLVLGFTISATLQSVVSASSFKDALGKAGPKQVALATVAGAASSSCSYASAAIMRTMFKKGAALATSLAFLFASTNLVIELGVILYVLMGWAFMVGEWIGGLVLIALMSVIVHLTAPASLIEEAREHEEEKGGHEHGSMMVEGDDWRERLRAPGVGAAIAGNFLMEWRMLWRDLAAGFLIGGFVAAFVPDAFWRTLFLTDASPWIKVPVDVLIGPLIAVLTFVCSIGNVPLAAMLWAGGASFGGVLAFLYADLIVLPLLDAYRRYFGWRMAAYIGVVLYVTMVTAAALMDVGFTALDLIPAHDTQIRERLTEFSLNYTFFLNLLAAGVVAAFVVITRRHPADHHHHHHDHERHHGHGAEGR